MQVVQNTPSKRYGMVVDLNRCVGCQTCTAACKHANDTTPGVQWRRVLDVEFGEYPDVQRLFLVTGCQHCEEPPCVPVCPTGATFAREDGLVAMRYDDCIGCGYCAVACPYQARTIVHDRSWYFGESTQQEEVVEHDERLGVAQKCSFCIERIDDAAQHGGTPGLNPDVTPACSSSCIAQAIHFGDTNDATSNVSQLLAENQSAHIHEGLGTRPQIHYLVETPAVKARDVETTEPPEGPLQTFWDLRAACNFVFGGIGSGFALAAFVAWLGGELSGHALTQAFAIAAIVMSVGLFAVFLEIGRKARALFAMKKIKTSWMTREIWAVIWFFGFGLLDLWLKHPVLHCATALGAAAFLYSQARILHAGRGIPAWRVAEMPTLIVASGLLEGVGLLALAGGLVPDLFAAPLTVSVMGAISIFISFGLWQTYTARARDREPDALRLEIRENRFPRNTRRVINAVKWPVHVLGHLLPLLMLALAFAFNPSPSWLWGFGGFVAIAGGAIWKVNVITRASHYQAMTLPTIPGRGSGTRAASPRYV